MDNEGRLRRVVDAFEAAAFDGTSWEEPLSALADITGSRSGQLIGIGKDAAVALNCVTGVSPEAVQEFEDIGGGNPDINPRVRAGMLAPELKVLAEHEFLPEAERSANPIYADFYRRQEIPFICLTSLYKKPDMLVGLAVMRSDRQGEIEPSQKDAFAMIAPQVRNAVRIRMLLEEQRTGVLKGTLESMGMEAILCDSRGRIRDLTPSAEQWLKANRLLGIRDNRLEAAGSTENQQLATAIAAATSRVRSLERRATQLLLRQESHSPVIVEIIALPVRDWSFGFEPCALVVIHSGNRRIDRQKLLLEQAYQLTPAEIDIALRLAAGQSPRSIGEARKVTFSTTRTQIRTIYMKLGVHRQSQLAALLHALR